MLSPKIAELLSEIEKLPLEQQEYIAEALAVELVDAQQPQLTLQDIVAELDEDIARGDVYDLDKLEELP